MINSLKSNFPDCFFSGKSLQEILTELSSQIDQHGDAYLVNEDRNDTLDGGRRDFTRKKIRTECKLNVNFQKNIELMKGAQRENL